MTARHPGNVGVFGTSQIIIRLINALALIRHASPTEFPNQGYVYADRLPHGTDVVVMTG